MMLGSLDHIDQNKLPEYFENEIPVDEVFQKNSYKKGKR